MCTVYNFSTSLRAHFVLDCGDFGAFLYHSTSSNMVDAWTLTSMKKPRPWWNGGVSLIPQVNGKNPALLTSLTNCPAHGPRCIKSHKSLLTSLMLTSSTAIDWTSLTASDCRVCWG
jgi:hypothetical protein